jgi:HK97 family phage portal protein
MALIDKVQRRRGVKAGVQAPDWALATAAVESRALPNLDLPAHQADLYRKLSWVNAAIATVARACALQPFNVYRLDGTQRVDVDNHPLEALLQRPNPLMSRYELLYATVAWRKLTGNAYWWLNRPSESAPPDEVWLLSSRRVQPVPDGRLYIKGYLYDPGDGVKMPLEPWQVVHFKGFHPANEFLGASDIEALAWAAEGDYKQSQWNVNFFSEDNAKFPGVLAFADPIPDEPWERMKREFRDQAGGVKRQTMRMMRNVGAGGVQWIQTNVSQRDMEFLEGRQFNKEEMWAVLAPGLASVLDVNATEANAMSGRKTLVDNAVWPELVAMAEKITNGLLPSYGEGLTADFDDPRITDRALELEERKVWQMTHTVDEVREHYDGDKGLGDERGALLVPQVEKLGGTPDVLEPPIAPGNVPGNPDTAGDAEPDAGGDDVKAERQVTAERESEMATWRRYAHKHGALKASGFKPDHLPSDVAGVIKARLQAATSDEEVHAAFSGPFLVKAVRVTDAGTVDPNGDAKDRAEARLKRILKERLNGQLQEVLALLGEPPNVNNLTAAFWETQAGALLHDLRPELERMAREAGTRLIVEQGIGVDWALVAEQAALWAEQYAYDLVRGLDDTTRRVLGEAVTRFIREGGTLGDLVDSLKPYFGEARAEAIAVTEVTRAFAQGELAAVAQAQAMGFKLEPVWQTNNDELVCSVCGPNHDKPRSKGWTVQGYPPAHPRCRCWINHEWEG